MCQFSIPFQYSSPIIQSTDYTLLLEIKHNKLCTVWKRETKGLRYLNVTLRLQSAIEIRYIYLNTFLKVNWTTFLRHSKNHLTSGDEIVEDIR